MKIPRLAFFKSPASYFLSLKCGILAWVTVVMHVVSGSFDAEKRSEINFSDVSFKIVIT